MRAPPRLRGGLGTRLMLLLLGLVLFALGIVALLESRLGLSPWDVFHQGLAEHTQLSFGAANVVVSIVVVAIAWALGARIGVGTITNAVLVGAFVQLFASFAVVQDLSHQPVQIRIGLLLAGLLLMGIGTGLYLGADLGAGPRDSLMVVGARRTQHRIGVVRTGLEVSVLAVGFALGGTVGVGTLAFAIGIGPSVEGAFILLERSPLGRKDIDSRKRMRRRLPTRGEQCCAAAERV